MPGRGKGAKRKRDSSPQETEVLNLLQDVATHTNPDAAFPSVSTKCKGRTNTSSQVSLEHIQQRAAVLIKTSISENTNLAYKTGLHAFNKFRNQYALTPSWPVPSEHLVLFVAYCFELGYASKTISLYCSGVSFLHKVNSWVDPSNSFVIKKLLEGCRRAKPTKDSRAPITKSLLKKICHALPFVCFSAYEANLFRAAYTLAYFGIFRVSEMVFTTSIQQDRPLKLNDVIVEPANIALRIQLRVSKTSQTGLPVIVRIPACQEHDICCVRSMTAFLEIRNKTSTLLFCHANGTPLTGTQFSAVLKKALDHEGVKNSNYKSHSFRIGRASDLASQGVTEEAIMKMGRWSSNAYKHYLRF